MIMENYLCQDHQEKSIKEMVFKQRVKKKEQKILKCFRKNWQNEDRDKFQVLALNNDHVQRHGDTKQTGGQGNRVSTEEDWHVQLKM